MSWKELLEKKYTQNIGWVHDICEATRRELKLRPCDGVNVAQQHAKVRINVKELWDQWNNWKRENIGSHEFMPWQKEPRPEWHGKTATYIGHGVIVFEADETKDYHLINQKYIERIS